MRERVKRNFPMVLLTLLSIVQALALELLWSHVSGAEYLFAATADALLGGLQILATFVGIVLIWVVYASAVMRFRWMPSIGDSVYPFIIGMIEFVMIEALGPGGVGRWIILTALMFAFMHWVNHGTMRRARSDPDNDTFFSKYAPATLRDFRFPILAVVLLLSAGLVLEFTRQAFFLALVALLLTNLVLVLQFRFSARIWMAMTDLEQSESETT